MFDFPRAPDRCHAADWSVRRCGRRAPAEAGTMDFIAGNALSVLGHTYDLSTVDSITVDNSVVAPQSVGITYGTSGAHLLVFDKIVEGER